MIRCQDCKFFEYLSPLIGMTYNGSKIFWCKHPKSLTISPIAKYEDESAFCKNARGQDGPCYPEARLFEQKTRPTLNEQHYNRIALWVKWSLVIGLLLFYVSVYI